MSIKQNKLIMNTFLKSQFSYSPITWMFHSRKSNNRINRIHENALKTVYNDNTTTFENLLLVDNNVSIHHRNLLLIDNNVSIHHRNLLLIDNNVSIHHRNLLLIDNNVSIHHRNLQVLPTEIYEIKNKISPEIMNDILYERSITYKLRNNSGFITYDVNTMRYGVDTIHHLGTKIWNLLPLSIKAAHDLNEFKNLIKSWTPKTWPCELCKTCRRTRIYIGTYHYRDKSSIFLVQYCAICVCVHVSVGVIYNFTFIFYIYLLSRIELALY